MTTAFSGSADRVVAITGFKWSHHTLVSFACSFIVLWTVVDHVVFCNSSCISFKADIVRLAWSRRLWMFLSRWRHQLQDSQQRRTHQYKLHSRNIDCQSDSSEKVIVGKSKQKTAASQQPFQYQSIRFIEISWTVATNNRMLLNIGSHLAKRRNHVSGC